MSSLLEPDMKLMVTTNVNKLYYMRYFESEKVSELLAPIGYYVVGLAKTAAKIGPAVGDFFATTRYTVVSAKLLKWIDANWLETGYIDENLVNTWFILLSSLALFSLSPNFLKQLIEAELHLHSVEIIKRKYENAYLAKEMLQGIILCSITIVISATDQAEGLNQLREKETIKAIRHYTRYHDHAIRLYSVLCLCLLDYEKDQIVEEFQIISTIVDWLECAVDGETFDLLQNDTPKEFDYATVVGLMAMEVFEAEVADQPESHEEEIKLLVKVLAKLAVAESNKRKIDEAGAIPILLEVMNNDSLKNEQALVCQIIGHLSSDEQLRKKYISNERLMGQLEKLTKSHDEGIRRSASSVKWTLVDRDKHIEVFKAEQQIAQQQQQAGLPKETAKSSQHIMISYCHRNKEKVMQIYEHLKDIGHKIWLDVNDMKVDMNSAMAKAIENAFVIISFVSEAYKESINCKSEAEYARDRGKMIIFVKVHPGWKPDDWLGFLMAGQLFVEFKDEKDKKFETSYSELLAKIGEAVSKTVGSSSTQPMLQSQINPHPAHSNPFPTQNNPSPSQTNPIESQINPTPSQTNPTQPQTNPTPSQVNPLPSQTNPPPPQTNSIESQIKPLHTQINPPPFQTNPPPSQSNLFPSQTYPSSSQTNPPSFHNRPPPSQTYPSSSQTYQPPFQTHPPPFQTHSPPSQTYPPSTQTYPPSFQTYSYPSQTYPHSVQTYPYPSQTYPPPSQTYPPPSQTYPPRQKNNSDSSLCVLL